MRSVFFASLLLISAAPAVVHAQAAAPTGAASGYTVDGTDIGTLLDDPAAKAVLEKNLPGFTTNPQIDMARSMTLKSVQPYSPTMTDDKLAAIQAELSKLPTKK